MRCRANSATVLYLRCCGHSIYNGNVRAGLKKAYNLADVPERGLHHRSKSAWLTVAENLYFILL